MAFTESPITGGAVGLGTSRPRVSVDGVRLRPVEVAERDNEGEGESDSAVYSAVGAIVTADRALEKTERAVQAIYQARASQLELAERAAINNNNEAREELQAEAQIFEDEIERIAGEATFNGQNLLASGFSITARNDAESLIGSTSVGPATSVTAASGIDISTIEGAESAEDALDELLIEGATYLAGVASERSGVSAFIEEANGALTPSGPTDEERATAATRQNVEAARRAVFETFELRGNSSTTSNERSRVRLIA